MSSSAAEIASRSRMSLLMKSALGFIHAGFPRRGVCGSRLSSARTCQPSRTRRSTTCEPIRPAAPVTSARFISCHFAIRRSPRRAPLQQFLSLYKAREKLPCVRRDICRRRIGKYFVAQTAQAPAGIDVISSRQKFDFESDLGCALDRLVEHTFGAPIDLLEQVRVRFLHSNQVIPSVVARTENNAILGLGQQFTSVCKVFRGHSWAVGIDQTHRIKTAL